MKVGINARTFSVSQPGGAVQAAMKLTRALTANASVEPVLFGHESIAERFPDTHIDDSLYIPRSQVYGLAWERSILPWLASKHDVDVLYCPNGNAPLHSISVPVVMCIHDVNAQHGWSGSIHELYRKTAVPRAATAADTITTVSLFSKEEIVNTLSIPPSKVDVVYNGVDSLFFEESSGEAFDLPDQYLLYVGAMNPRKNVRRLIEAFDRLKHRTDLPHKLVLVGPDNKHIFQSMDIEATSEVVLPGYVTQRELKFAYDNAAAFVFPSLYEGFGLPPLEAMACGTPVVASNATSLPEVLGDAAVLVDPKNTAVISDAIERVIRDEGLRRQLVEKGREQAQSFHWKRVGSDMMSIFNKK